jgi:glycosyltransferase involved in cell wall biosynthesis
MKLLVFNYSMNRNSQVFSHQKKIVEELSGYFSHIDVVTAESFNDSTVGNVKVFSTHWRLGHKFSNLLSFYRVALPLLFQYRGGVVFSHMTEVQSFLAALICKALRIKHYLWYAHKSSSFYLTFSYPFLEAIITSTSGSCPIRGKKVIPIGQSVDRNLGSRIDRAPLIPPKSWYHVGRTDPSKNIEIIATALLPFYELDNSISLHLYGTSSSRTTAKYFETLKKTLTSTTFSNWVHFHGPVRHSELARISMQHDGFIHAFWGSLDKALVEAIMLKRIVISSNPEYLIEFIHREGKKETAIAELTRQLRLLYASENHVIRTEIARKYKIAATNHSLQNWSNRLVAILKEA